MWEPPAGHPLKRMFAGLAEHAFISRLGVADPPLIDYVSSLLSRFVHFDAVFPMRNARGQPLVELADMVNDAADLPAGGRTQREFFRHIGDFALFWTGLYPETFERMHSRRSRDHFVDFTVQGKRGYWMASQFEDEPYRDEVPVLRRLASEFELCAIGLREVRREWEESARDNPSAGRLIQ